MKLATFTESLLKEGKVTIDGQLIPFAQNDLDVFRTKYTGRQ